MLTLTSLDLPTVITAPKYGGVIGRLLISNVGAIAYYFSSRNTALTSISHNTAGGCTSEIEPLTTLIESSKYWEAAVASVGQLTTLKRTQDDQYQFCEEVGY